MSKSVTVYFLYKDGTPTTDTAVDAELDTWRQTLIKTRTDNNGKAIFNWEDDVSSICRLWCLGNHEGSLQLKSGDTYTFYL